MKGTTSTRLPTLPAKCSPTRRSSSNRKFGLSSGAFRVQGGEYKAALHPAGARFATYDEVKRRRDHNALLFAPRIVDASGCSRLQPDRKYLVRNRHERRCHARLGIDRTAGNDPRIVDIIGV